MKDKLKRQETLSKTIILLPEQVQVDLRRTEARRVDVLDSTPVSDLLQGAIDSAAFAIEDLLYQSTESGL